MKIKNLKTESTPANFVKIERVLKDGIVSVKCAPVKKLCTNVGIIDTCFHPISRILEVKNSL